MALFQKGNKMAPGGARPGAGRKPDWFKEWLGDLLHDEKVRLRYEKILKDDEDADEMVTSEGVCVPHRAKAATYLQALELAFNYDQGKPNQPLELNDTTKRPNRGDLETALARLQSVIDGVGVAEGK